MISKHPCTCPSCGKPTAFHIHNSSCANDCVICNECGVVYDEATDEPYSYWADEYGEEWEDNSVDLRADKTKPFCDACKG